MLFDFLLCTEFQTRAYNYNYALQLSVTSDIKLKLAEFKAEMGIKKPFGSFYISQQLHFDNTQSLAPADFTDAVFTHAQFQKIPTNQRAAQNNYYIEPDFGDCSICTS